MYEKELQRILNASQNNALTFFVGAGVSALSGAPTGKALIHAISDELEKMSTLPMRIFKFRRCFIIL